MADLSVVIVSHNARDCLERCLRQLFAAACALDLEVIVVDNGSTDGSLEVAQRHEPSVTVIPNAANVGFAAANNQALKLAHAPVVLLLNSDAFIPTNLLNRVLEVFCDNPRAGLIGVRIMNLDGTLQAQDGTFPTLVHDVLASLGLERTLARRQRHRTDPGWADWVHGACMFARMAAVRDVGGLDDRYFLYSEEVDWCRRFWRAGWEVWYLPDLAVTHVGGASSACDEQRRLALYRSRLGYRRKESGPLASSALWSFMLAGLVARIILRGSAELVLRRRLGAHDARADWALLRGLTRVDPRARWVVS